VRRTFPVSRLSVGPQEGIIVYARRVQRFEEPERALEIPLRNRLKQAAGFVLDALVDSGEFAQTRRNKDNQQTSAILRIRLTANVARFLEAIERDGDAAAR
jgi:hypothetical protein